MEVCAKKQKTSLTRWHHSPEGVEEDGAGEEGAVSTLDNPAATDMYVATGQNGPSRAPPPKPAASGALFNHNRRTETASGEEEGEAAVEEECGRVSLEPQLEGAWTTAGRGSRTRKMARVRR